MRATRRYNELLKTTSIDTTYNEVLAKLQVRDKQDSERINSPLKIPKDAIVLDTTNLNIQSAFDLAVSYIE